MSIGWTDEALADVELILASERRFSDAAADRLATTISRVAERFDRFPNSGRAVPEWGSDIAREVPVGRFRLLYQVVGRDVLILGFFPAAIPLPPLDPETNGS